MLDPGVTLGMVGVVGGVPYCSGLSSARRLCISDGGVSLGEATVASSLSKH